MDGHRAQGIILRKTNYSESDLIFDLLTDNGDVIGFFARGARKLKSRLSGLIQVGLVVDMTYEKGKNLSYPREMAAVPSSLFTFYARSVTGLNFFTDLMLITRAVVKDLKHQDIYTLLVSIFCRAEAGEELLALYNEFISELLAILDVDTSLRCYFSGEVVSEPEFYYSADTNRVISKARKPKSVDLPVVTFDEVFRKTYLQNLVKEHLSERIRLSFAA